MSATNRGAQRRFRDNYPTPIWAVEKLIPEIVWGECPMVLEPCVGTGAVLSTIIDHVNCRYHGFDIVDTPFFPSTDFLGWADNMLIQTPGKRWDFIVTNPPFSLALEFIDKSLTLANCVIMLLPMSFLGSSKRRDWWKQHPPTGVFILSKRPSFTGDGKTDSEVYGWFVFDTTGRQKIGFHWL